MAHHPEKFLDGRMLWRGRIYSPLPFVRSLWGTRINAGVWGTAAFPSVYRTDVHPFAFLPHSVRLAGAVVRADAGGLAWSRRGSTSGRRRCCSGAAWSASRSRSRRTSPTRCGRTWIHCPAAGCGTARRWRISTSSSRSRGSAAGSAACCRRRKSRCRRTAPQTSRGPRPSLAEAWRALAAHLRAASPRIASGARRGRRPSACWRSSPTGCADRAPSGRSKSTKDGRTIATSASSSAAGHGSTSARSSRSTAAARALLRVSTHLRPTSFGVVSGDRARRRAARRRDAPDSRCDGRSAGAIAGALIAVRHRVRRRGARRRRRRSCGAAIERVRCGGGMTRMQSGPARVPLLAPSSAARLRPAQRRRSSS